MTPILKKTALASVSPQGIHSRPKPVLSSLIRLWFWGKKTHLRLVTFLPFISNFSLFFFLILLRYFNRYFGVGCLGAGTGRLVFRNVPVPEENLLGRENEGAKVFYKLMVPERILGGGEGVSWAILVLAARYTNKR